MCEARTLQGALVARAALAKTPPHDEDQVSPAPNHTHHKRRRLRHSSITPQARAPPRRVFAGERDMAAQLSQRERRAQCFQACFLRFGTPEPLKTPERAKRGRHLTLLQRNAQMSKVTALLDTCHSSRDTSGVAERPRVHETALFPTLCLPIIEREHTHTLFGIPVRDSNRGRGTIHCLLVCAQKLGRGSPQVTKALLSMGLKFARICASKHFRRFKPRCADAKPGVTCMSCRFARHPTARPSTTRKTLNASRRASTELS